MTYCGIPRRAMQAQRSYNFHMDELHAFTATAPRAPWMMPVRALSGNLEGSVGPRERREAGPTFLTTTLTAHRKPVAPPQRVQPAINLQNFANGADARCRTSSVDRHVPGQPRCTGATRPAASRLTAASSRAKPRRRTSRRIWPHRSLRVGKVCFEMIPRLIDVKRQIRVLASTARSARSRSTRR